VSSDSQAGVKRNDAFQTTRSFRIGACRPHQKVALRRHQRRPDTQHAGPSDSKNSEAAINDIDHRTANGNTRIASSSCQTAHAQIGNVPSKAGSTSQQSRRSAHRLPSAWSSREALSSRRCSSTTSSCCFRYSRQLSPGTAARSPPAAPKTTPRTPLSPWKLLLRHPDKLTRLAPESIGMRSLRRLVEARLLAYRLI
jgi:hypothetical protein